MSRKVVRDSIRLVGPEKVRLQVPGSVFYDEKNDRLLVVDEFITNDVIAFISHEEPNTNFIFKLLLGPTNVIRDISDGDGLTYVGEIA